jgi:hypothetical protein
VFLGMEQAARRLKAPEWLIVLGVCGFIAALALSAFWDPSIRWLHFFQAWMYLAALGFALRSSRWGYFIGVSAAGLWAYANLFVTTFLRNGLEQLFHWIQTGGLARPDLLIAVPAWLSNLLVVIGCVWAYLRLPARPLRDLAGFLIAFVLTTGFFAADMAICQPRYLPLFPSLLHPHRP